MPTPKAGTVTADVVTAVREFGAGRLEFRNDAGGNVHLPVGRTDFADGDLKVNIEAVISHITKIRPHTAKGQYVKRVCLAGAQTPGITIQPEV
jgi:large subunit ribosomal protein L1